MKSEKVRVFIGDTEVFELVPLVLEVLARSKQIYVSGEELRRFVRNGGYQTVKAFNRLFTTQSVMSAVARDYTASLGV